MKTQIKKKIILFFLLGFTFLLFIPNSRAEINCSLDVVYHFNDQQIEIVITNNEDGDINHFIARYTIHNQNSGYLIQYPPLLSPDVPWMSMFYTIPIEPRDSITLIYDFPATLSDVIEVMVYFESGDIMNFAVIAGFKEGFIFNTYVISIVSSIGVITIVVVLYFKKIKPTRIITQFKIRIDDIKSTINEMNYNDARTALYSLQREYNDDEINSFTPVIDDLIIQCNYNISFMERKQHFINVFKQGESKTAYQGLVDLQKQYNSSDYHGLIDPAIHNQIVETLKKFSEHI